MFCLMDQDLFDAMESFNLTPDQHSDIKEKNLMGGALKNHNQIKPPDSISLRTAGLETVKQ